MKLTNEQKKKVSAVAQENDLEFIRVFGSSVKTPLEARDIDLVVFSEKGITLKAISQIESLFENLFEKPIDIVELKSDLDPLLVLEIAAHSQPLYERPQTGLFSYVELMDRFHAIAQDEILSYPDELRKKMFERIQRKIDVA